MNNVNKEQLKENVKRMEAQQIQLGVEIAEMKKELSKPSGRREHVKESSNFYIIDEKGSITALSQCNDRYSNFCYASHNYYKTKVEAEEALELQTIENELCALIEEINDGWVADYSDLNDDKYVLSYNGNSRSIYEYNFDCCKYFKTKFICKRMFKQDAINKIGEKRLTKYLKNR